MPTSARRHNRCHKRRYLGTRNTSGLRRITRAAASRQMAPIQWVGMRKKVGATGRLRAGGRGQDAIDQIAHVDHAEPAFAAGDLQREAAGNRTSIMEHAGVARTIDHGRTHDHRLGNRRTNGAFGLQLRLAVVRQRARFGVLIQRSCRRGWVRRLRGS